MAQATQTGALYQPRGAETVGDGREIQEGAACACLWEWPVHAYG